MPNSLTPSAPASGASAAASAAQRRKRAASRLRLRVSVKAMDLRCVTRPILVGHYDEDPISGAEAIIDRHLVHRELSIRYNLGMYAGGIGTAIAVMLPRTAAEQRRGRFRGCIVAGLGKYDGTLTPTELTEAAHKAGLRYLLHALDSAPDREALTGEHAELELSSLMIGYNSSANLTIADAVGALIRGIVEANRRFQQQKHSPLHIRSLQIVEVYLDTAIAALDAVQWVAESMQADARNGVIVEPAAALEYGEGMCQRLLEKRGGSYWPRLIVTRETQDQDTATPEAREPSGRAPAHGDGSPSERIQFLYLGERARAEQRLHERQTRAVEQLVAKQVHCTRYQPDFSRSLFNLLLPHELKDFARQIDRIILVVDGYTGNLPWELMMADEVPLATQVAMVRQLASARFRSNVRQTVDRWAYVVGNPSIEGYAEAFTVQGRKPAGLSPLAAAQAEAESVSRIIDYNDFDVVRVIGEEKSALDVINGLYRRPYRIVHISAHGLHQQRAADGKEYTGVVLSDGVLLTAAEFDALESVPELVFLNCCLLGKLDGQASAAPTGRLEFNKLAYSVARELIEDGVRAVIAAGWAVGEEPSLLFAETFYNAMLKGKQAFGEAVLRARAAVWEKFHDTSNTWGAFHAYGDPAWRLEPHDPLPAVQRKSQWKPVAPEQLLDAIANLRFGLQQMHEAPSRNAKHHEAQLERLLRACKKQPQWLERPDVNAAIAAFYADLGPEYYPEACERYRRAIASADTQGRVPISVIEQLADIEVRRGEWEAEIPLIDQAMHRLQRLDELVGLGQPAATANPQRAALLAGALKSRAAVLARRIVADSSAASQHAQEFETAVRRAALEYQKLADLPGTIESLLLEALVPSTEQSSAALQRAQRCVPEATAAFEAGPEFSSAILDADAQLALALHEQSFGRNDAQGERVFDAIKQQYGQARSAATCRPAQLDAVVRKLQLLGLFHEALASLRTAPDVLRVAGRLRQVAQSLDPAAQEEPDRRAPASSAEPRAGHVEEEMPDSRRAHPQAKQGQEAPRLQ